MRCHRRDFLTTSTTTAVAAWGMGSLAADVLAGGEDAARRAGPNDTVSCAVIGLGRGASLMGWAVADRAAEVTTLCDVNEQRLEALAQSLKKRTGKAPQRHSDFRRVLEDKAINAVFIATPHHWHVPLAIRVLEAGKHVYLEKPASHVFAEGRRLVEAVRKSKLVLQHGTQMRSSEVTAAAAKVLKSGILGDIKQAKAWGVEPRPHHAAAVPDSPAPDYLNWDVWLGPATKRPFNSSRWRRWNNFREYGNGEIGGDGIHDIDMARWGLGVTTHPQRITAHGSRIHLQGQSDFPDNMLVSYQYAEGKVLIYENRNFAPYKMHGWDNGNIFYGTEGYMVFSRRGYFQTYLSAKEEKGPGMRGGAGNAEHVHNFLASVRGEAMPHADARTAHLSCGLVHLGEIAYRTGKVLTFDPSKERFDDAQANELLSKKYRKPWVLKGVLSVSS